MDSSAYRLTSRHAVIIYIRIQVEIFFSKRKDTLFYNKNTKNNYCLQLQRTVMLLSGYEKKREPYDKKILNN
jgi:hypothetical protein